MSAILGADSPSPESSMSSLVDNEDDMTNGQIDRDSALHDINEVAQVGSEDNVDKTAEQDGEGERELKEDVQLHSSLTSETGDWDGVSKNTDVTAKKKNDSIFVVPFAKKRNSEDGSSASQQSEEISPRKIDSSFVAGEAAGAHEPKSNLIGLEKVVLREKNTKQTDTNKLYAVDSVPTEEHVFGNDETESRKRSSSMPVSDAGAASSTQSTPGAFAIENPLHESSIRQEILEANANANDDDSDDRESNNTAPEATVVLARQSTMHESHHKDPEVGQQFLNAVCVENEPIVEARIVPFDGIEESTEQSNRRLRWGIIAGIAMLGGMTIFLVVLLTQQRRPETSSSTTKKDNLVKDNVFAQNKTERLLEILAPLAGVNFFDVDSPEHSFDRQKALWFLVNDELLDIYDPRVEWKVRQRYVLALLYTSTNGHKWHEELYFMTDLDECNWSAVSREKDVLGQNSFEPNLFSVKGVVCNRLGKVERIRIGWNGLYGTLPHELSEFSNNLVELYLDGGSIYGQIPKSFEKLKKLEILGLQDNCLSGTIPEFSGMPDLKQIFIANNAGLSGSLNEFCTGTERTRLVDHDLHDHDIYVDCGKLIECDCCSCCNPDNFECCSAEGECFNRISFDDVISRNVLSSFQKGCMSEKSNTLVQTECPCYTKKINGTDDKGDPVFVRQCTTDCDAKDAYDTLNKVEN